MNFVHEELKVGRCRSVNQALQIVKKDRKTVDRFKHIYYLNATDPDLLKQVTIYLCEHERRNCIHLKSYIVAIANS